MSRNTFVQLALMGLGVLLFSTIWDWSFTLVFMGSLLFHEYGHVWAMKRCGMDVKGVYVIPFIGAAAVTQDRFPSRKAEVVVALMGPAWGFALALATYGAYLATGHPLLSGIVFVMAMLNLFNLLPFNPMDGGRVAKSLAYYFSPGAGVGFLTVGVIASAILGLSWRLPIFITALVVFYGYSELRREIEERRRSADRRVLLPTLAEAYGVEPNADAIWAEVRRRFETSGSPLLAAYMFECAAHDALENAGLKTGSATGDPKEYGLMAHESVFYAPSFAESRLGKILSSRELPNLTTGQWIGSFAAYAALAAALFLLMAAGASAPGASEALNAFMRK